MRKDKEITPLISSAKGNGSVRIHRPPSQEEENGFRQRRTGQPKSQHYYANDFQAPRDYPNNTSFTSLDQSDTDKKKAKANRPFLRNISNVAAFVAEVISRKQMDRVPSTDLGQDVQYSLDSKSGREYYEDTYNDLPYQCSFGTTERDGIWMNHQDPAGLVMSVMVWIFIVYASFTVSLLVENNSLPSFVAITYNTLCFLALASHAKTTFTDPGAVPSNSLPTEDHENIHQQYPMCSICQTYKPPRCHHCRICGRCVSRMDHHCPWMNNCIGAGNMKHFILFLLYVWVASTYALIFFGMNYFLCDSEECEFSSVITQLVRVMTALCFMGLIFTSNMIMSVMWGIMTGLGTVDRLKLKAYGLLDKTDSEAVPLKDIFGIGPFWTWCLPMDPIFEDYDRIMGYSTTQRLLRERATRSSYVTHSDSQSGTSMLESILF